MTFDSEGVALVTGGASGIGYAIADELISRGMTVIVSDIDQERLEGARESLGAETIYCDVSDLSSVEAARDEVHHRFGPLALLCNNAGVGQMAKLTDMSVHEWRRVIDTNLFGVVHGLSAFLPPMIERGGGHILNTASLAGLYAFPDIGAYTASKYAVVGLSETMRLELAGTGVGVSVLCPGVVRTNIFSRRPDVAAQESRPLETKLKQRETAARAMKKGLDPGHVARRAIDGVQEDAFWILVYQDEVEALDRKLAELRAIVQS